MDFSLAIIIVTIIITEVQGKQVDPGRQVLTNPSHLPPQPAQQKYATKEVILYLTPSQIRALQEGQGLNYPRVPLSENEKHTQAYVRGSPQALVQQQIEHGPLKPSTNQEPQSDKFIPIIPPPEYRRPKNNAFKSFQAQNQKRIPQPVPFFPDPNREVPNNEPQAIPALNYQHNLENDHDNQDNHQQLKEKFLHLLNQNIAQFKALQALSQTQQEKSNEKTNFNYLTQNDYKYASDVYSLVRSNNEHQSDKQQAILQTDAIANAQPLLVHKEITIKHSPAQLITPVPVPRPVLIPVPNSYKVPPYTVPLELIRTVPVPIAGPQKTVAGRPVPVGTEKRNQSPTSNHAYIDRPYFGDGGFPIDNLTHNREKTSVTNHEWRY